MRVLHLSTGDARGAFAAAYRLHKNFQASGHDSLMIVGSKLSNDDSVIAAPTYLQKFRYWAEKISNFVAGLALGRKTQSTHIFKLNVALVRTSFLTDNVKKFKPDLIIVNYVADFLSEEQLYAIRKLSDAPIAFYLMDMGMLTGACHYAWECAGYTAGCASCPKTDSKIIKRLIKNKFEGREYYYQKIMPIIVAGSEELARQAENSALTKKLAKTKILIGIDPSKYGNFDRSREREEYGFSNLDFVVYFGAQSVDDERKGFKYLIRALELIASRLTEAELAKVVLFTVGAGNPFQGGISALKHKHIDYISDPTKFAKTYAAADLFVCPSVEDSGPMMINESIMSGTPVIAFKSGVALDLVINGVTGYAVDKYSSESMAERIIELLRTSSASIHNMRENCRTLGLEKCSSASQIGGFSKLKNLDSSSE